MVPIGRLKAYFMGSISNIDPLCVEGWHSSRKAHIDPQVKLALLDHERLINILLYENSRIKWEL